MTSTASVTVNQTATSVAVTPGTAPLNENGRQQFTATAYDQFGAGPGGASRRSPGRSPRALVRSAPAACIPRWPRRALPPSGPPRRVVSGTASVTVTNAAPTVAAPAAASPSPVTGTTTALSVLGADDGGEPGLTYTWAATRSPSAPRADVQRQQHQRG